MRRFVRRGLLAVSALILGIVGTVLCLEIVLRFLPIMEGAYVAPVNAADPVMHYEPNSEYVWSLGPTLAFPVKGRTNNLGWINGEDYDSVATTPLLAVVGDSFVESIMVPDSATMQFRLRARAGPGKRVYSFGMSGAPLPQYLAEAQYVRDKFRPAAIVVIIGGNDFDESLGRFKSAVGQHYFADAPDSTLVLERADYQPSRVRRFLRHSALVRYFYIQTRGVHIISSMVASASSAITRSPRTVAVPMQATPDRIAWSKLAVRKFLSDLPSRSGISPGSIVLVVDGPRPQPDGPPLWAFGQQEFFSTMRDFLIPLAKSAGYEVVDMAPVFAHDFSVNHRRFEFPMDAHWNGYGNRVAAAAVERTPVFQRFVTGAPATVR